MKIYQVYVQYQSITCKHRFSDDVYVRALNEEDARTFVHNIPSPRGYIIRQTKVLKDIEVYEVKYE